MLDKLNLLLFGLSLPLRLVAICLPMALIAFVAYKSKHLSISGSITAWLCGVIILFCLRFEGFLLFCIFYVSCNIVGKLCKAGNKIEKKGSCRDWVQVLANGFMAVFASISSIYIALNAALVIFSCSVAEACADTWAGDVGRLSKQQPVSLRTLKVVEKGTSGGVTVLGFAASLLACFMIAMFHSLFWGFDVSVFLIIIVSSFVGCIADSFLGATCQALYVDKDGKPTEKETDTLIRGVKWIDNDMVNFMSNVFSCVLGLTLFKLWT